jgi:hypothetical protein
MPPARRPGLWLATACATVLALTPRVVAARATTVAAPCNIARAGVRTVPDDAPTIRAALDSIYAEGTVVESVFVRVGAPMEPLVIADVERHVVLLGLPDPDGTLPQIGALSIYNFNARFIARSFHFTAGIRIAGVLSYPPTFFDCVVDSAVDVRDVDASVSMFRCTVIGHPGAIGCYGPLVLDSCRVTGEVTATSGNASLDVRHSVMTGPGNYPLYGDAQTCVIIGNTIRGYDEGIYTRTDVEAASILDNLVEDCPGTGIYATNGGDIRSNRIRNCGAGILAYGSADVSDNTVLGCAGVGMVLNLAGGSVRGNVVGRSGHDGLQIACGGEYADPASEIARNTSFSNGGSGFVLTVGSYAGAVAPISNNIGFGNDGFGLVSDGISIPVLSCNDWFANDSGAVSGVSPSAQDVAIDPRFCNLANDDVHLAAGSPLLDAPGCGLIGALGQGCELTTATLVTFFTAEREADCVRLRWQLGDATRHDGVWIERADVAAGPWTRVATEGTTEGGVSVGLDRSALADREYWYRLAAREGTRVVAISEPVSVQAGLAREFALVGVTPNPGLGSVKIGFTVAREAAVEVDLFDVQGRHVASLAHGTLAAGTHTIEWSDRSASPGVYLLEFRYPGGHQIRRVVRLR